MGKTKRKRRPSSEKKTHQGASAAVRVQGGTRFSVVNKGQNKRKKTYFHKTKTNREESAAVVKCKEAFISYNEESDDKE